jgi:uncharacterized protein
VTPQEEQLLQSLVERVNSTQLEAKDQDAELLLKQNLGSNPDAIYILAQTVLVQNIALEQAKAQVVQLQQQATQSRQPAHATSFLGSLLGHRDTQPAPANPAFNTAPPSPYQPGQQSGFEPVPQGPYQAAPVQYAPIPSAQIPPSSAAGPSFLRGAMQTAAGVAAGALAFEGVESVLHGLSGGWGGPSMGMGPGLMGGSFERPVDETVINNYYDQPGDHGGEHHEAGEQRFDAPSENSSDDRSGAQFTDASYNAADNDRGFDDQSGADHSDFDNSGIDSNGNLDDGGSGFDDSGDFGGDGTYQ